MFGLHIGLICFLQIGITLANDYTYEVLSEPKESQESKCKFCIQKHYLKFCPCLCYITVFVLLDGEVSYPYEISSTELGKRQGYYRTEKQDGVAASVSVIVLKLS